MGLADRLRQRIRASGPLPFRAWVAACLYDPEEGYYMRPGRKTGTGRDADFVTPPTLHPFFGAAIGMQVRDEWQRAGRPAAWTVLELGGGEGDLAANAVAWMDAHEPALARAVRWLHQEPSPHHRAAQQAKCVGPRFRWVAPGEAARADVLVLCEVVDAMPFDLWERGEAGWRQVGVGLDGDRFVEVTLDEVADGPALPDEAQPGDRAALASLADFVQACEAHLAPAGAVLVVDYGGRGRGWLPQARAFRGHAHVPLVGQEPGTYDLTADVDFAATRSALAPLGVREASCETLEAFLLRHGILDALNRVDRSTAEGASSYLRLRQLLLPTGLGAQFKVQLLRR